MSSLSRVGWALKTWVGVFVAIRVYYPLQKFISFIISVCSYNGYLTPLYLIH